MYICVAHTNCLNLLFKMSCIVFRYVPIWVGSGCFTCLGQ